MRNVILRFLMAGVGKSEHSLRSFLKRERLDVRLLSFSPDKHLRSRSSVSSWMSEKTKD